MKKGNAFEEELKKNIKDFTYASKYIALRLWPKDYVEANYIDKIIYRENIDGIITVLVFDFPTTVRSITTEEIKIWDVPLDSLFDIGMKNVINNYPIEINIENIVNKSCYVFNGNHFFVGVYVYILSKYPECIGRYGTIISFPHRHAMIVYPINGLDIFTSINTLMAASTGMYNEGPGSISPNIYLYKGEKFINLPYEITEDSIKFYPPDDYIEIMGKITNEENYSQA